MWNICRTCMNKEVEMISIFNQSKSPSINTMLMAISSLEFLPNDKLPSQICVTCLETLETTYYFKEQVIRCNNALQEQTQKLLLTTVKKEDDEEEEKYFYDDKYVRIVDSDDRPSKCHEPLIINNDPSPKNVINSLKLDQSLKSEDKLDNPTNYHQNSSEESSEGSDDMKNVNCPFEEIVIKSEEVEVEEHGVQYSENCEMVPTHNQRISQNGTDDDDFSSDEDFSLTSPHESLGNCNTVQNIQENFKEKHGGKTGEDSEGTSFMQMCSMNRHIRLKTHEVKPKSHKCEVCGEEFDRPSNVKKHMRKHTGEAIPKPYKCKVCNKPFSKPSKVMVHMRTHTGEKPYNCQHCDATFTQNGNLKLHIRNRHTAEIDKPKTHKCEVCGNTFTTTGSLKLHMRRHTGERPFKCPHCDLRYMTVGNLQQHIRSHTGEATPKPHKCEVCQKSFVAPCHLKIHMRKHTGERPFKCQHCDMRFTYSGSLKNHIRLHSVEATNSS